MTVEILKMSDADFALAEEVIDLSNGDAEFLSAFKTRSENIHAIYGNGEIKGAAHIAKGKKAYIYIHMGAEYRRQGIGGKALRLCEQTFVDSQTESVITTYKADNKEARSFAGKYGYKRKFSSAYMKYTGQPFDVASQSIRAYCDEDYDAAHEMYAIAFHEMRMSVGDFPESVIEEPSEKMRSHWAKTSDERLVYTKDQTVVGYARVEGNEIASISVKSEYHGQGIGQNFMKYICNKILSEKHDSVDLYCVVGNKARKLYDKMGFKEIYTAEFAEKRFE